MPKLISTENKTRKLVAVLFIDIQGYTELMHHDEQRADEMIQWFNKVVKSSVSEFDGTIIQFYGDGCLMSFPTATRAVRCAYEMQSEFTKQNSLRVPVRMGIHLGDVIYREDNVYGDTVNIASRIESLGVPGSILLSSSVRDQVQNQQFKTVSVGKFHFKNLTRRMEIFALDAPGLVIPGKYEMSGKLKKNRFEGLHKIGYSLLLTIVVFSILFSVLKKNFTASNTTPEHPVLAIYPFQVEDEEHHVDGNTFATLLAEKFSFTNNLTTIWPSSLTDVKELMRKAQLFSIDNEGSFLDSIRVTHYLKGSIGSKVNVSLHSVSNPKAVWQDSFEVQDMIEANYLIYQNITEQLQVEPNLAAAKNRSEERDDQLVELFQKALRKWNHRQDPTQYFYCVDLLLEALKIDNTDPKVNGFLALLYQTGMDRSYYSDIEKPDIKLKVHRYANLALKEDPNQPYALLAKGGNAFFQLDFGSAIEYLEKAQAVAPEMVLTTQALASFFLYTGDYANALKYIQQANAAKPGDRTILRNLSWSLTANGFVKASKENSEWLLRVYPKEQRTNYYLWDYYLIQKDFKKALNHIPKGIQGAFRFLMEGIVYIEKKDDLLLQKIMLELEENIKSECLNVLDRLPESDSNERTQLEAELSDPFSKSQNGYISIANSPELEVDCLSKHRNEKEPLNNACRNLDRLSGAYNSLKLLSAFYSGTEEEKNLARQYFLRILESKGRFPGHWFVQTYPFECFNTFRTDSEIQLIAGRHGINYGEHPWYKIQYEAK